MSIDATRAVSLRRGDHDPPVATSKIVNNVSIFHVGKLQHGPYCFLGGGNIRNVELALALALGRGQRNAQNQQGESSARGQFSVLHRSPPVDQIKSSLT
jgi:hypothetical protein